MKKLLYFSLFVFLIFSLAGCDSVFGDDDDDDDDENTIDISSRNLTVGYDDDYDSDFLTRDFRYTNPDGSEGFYLYFYYASDPSITKPEPGTYSVVPGEDLDAAGEVEVSYQEELNSNIIDESVSGTVTVSSDSMTITLSDVVGEKWEYDFDSGTLTDLGDVTLTGSTTVTSYN